MNASNIQGAIHPKTVAGWRSWLSRHRDRTGPVWVIFFKKATGKRKLSFEEAIDEAACWGWIDCGRSTLDAERSMMRFAPRKPGSGWSRVNKERAERMIAEGRMAEPGLRGVETARADGSWSRLDAIERLEIPADLARAFRARPGSRKRFRALPRSAQRATLRGILEAKRKETRAKRVAAAVSAGRD